MVVRQQIVDQRKVQRALEFDPFCSCWLIGDHLGFFLFICLFLVLERKRWVTVQITARRRAGGSAHTRGNVRIKLRQCAGFASRPGSSFALSPTGLVLITGQQDQASSMCLFMDKTIQALKTRFIYSGACLYLIFHSVVYPLLTDFPNYEPYKSFQWF